MPLFSGKADVPLITTFPNEFLDRQPLDLWSGAVLSEDQLRGLAIGAWYADSWGAYHDTLALVPEYPGEGTTRREKTIDVLHKWWDVTSFEDVMSTVSHLHHGMHSATYALIHPLSLQAFVTPDPDRLGELAEQHRGMLRQLAAFRGFRSPDALVHDYDAWLQAMKLGATASLPQPLVGNIVAWDLVRAAFIVRAGYTAGYVTDEVASEQLAVGLRIAQRHYRNWRQLGEAYITGATYWQATQDLSAAKATADERRLSMVRLWERPLSPWRRVALHPGAPVFGLSAHHVMPAS